MDERFTRLFEGARLPRYTSYPTAPHFSAAVGREAHAEWLASVPAEADASFYFHVPYCRDICWYCGCTTHALGRPERAVAYGELLRRELATASALLPHLRVSHLHWGGGTPTILGDDLFRVMDDVRRFASIEAGAEVAIEIDPRIFPAGMARSLVAGGFTRASLGVQSFQPRVQEAINRRQSLDQTTAAVEALRGAGIGALNFDLLYGLPHQTVEGAEDTARLVAALRPDRVAVFGYAHLPSRMKHQRLIDGSALPDATGRLRQFNAIAEVFQASGYVAIGLDHFALPHDSMAVAAANGTLHRNFQGYTTDESAYLLGFGCSSISAFPQGYVQAHADLVAWREAVAAGQLPTQRGLRLSAEDRARRAAIEAVMCRGEVDPDAVAAELGVGGDLLQPDEGRLAELAGLGIVERRGRRLVVPERHWPLLRLVAAAFDRYLGAGPASHAPAV
ncbi:MAG: oxygen-independent coproporphyrinogen III oxidase [Geminicoccaceae bacterium]